MLHDRRMAGLGNWVAVHRHSGNGRIVPVATVVRVRTKVQGASKAAACRSRASSASFRGYQGFSTVDQNPPCVIGDRISICKKRGRHQAFAMRTPAAAFG
jgi:hypothetical protein